MTFLLNGSCSGKLLIAPYEKHFFYVISKTLGSLNAYGFEAQSTRIRIFLNPQLFLSGFNFFFRSHVAYSNRIRLSTRIGRHLAGFTLEKLDLHLFFGFETIRIHRPWYIIRFVDNLLLRIYFFPRWRSRFKKYPDSLPESPDAFGRKPYPCRKKKLCIQKYLDTCKRSLNNSMKWIDRKLISYSDLLSLR